jgi:hypothetical protein
LYVVSVKDLITYINGISSLATIGKFYNPPVKNCLSPEDLQKLLDSNSAVE